MNQDIKVTEQEIQNYFIKEQKIIKYASEFFKEICATSITTESCQHVNGEVLPLSCYDLIQEMVNVLKAGRDDALSGGFVSAGEKQAYIKIGIDTKNSILNKDLKRTVRHEIIHYYLWLLDLPYDDNDLEFWCFCHVYDAGAYVKLSKDDRKYYQLFVELYDKYVADLQLNVRHLITGQMIAGIGNHTYEQYSEYILETINQCKKLFRLN